MNEPDASIVACHVLRFTTPVNWPEPLACAYFPVPPVIVAVPLNFVRIDSDRARPSTFIVTVPPLALIVTTPLSTTECASVILDRTEPANVPVAVPVWTNLVPPAVLLTTFRSTCSLTG